MKKIACSMLLVAVFAFSGRADDGFPRIPLYLDMIHPVDAYNLHIASGTTPGVKVYTYLDGAMVTNLTNWTASAFLYPPNVPAVRRIDSSESGPGWFIFDLATADTATNGTMESQIMLTGPFGESVEWARGRIVLMDSPATETTETLDLLTPFNWGWYSFTGTAPMLNVGTNGIMMNGVLLTTWPELPEDWFEHDPVYESEKSMYATGTPLYAYTETDPMWVSERSNYATGTPLYAYTETDPLWRAESGAVYAAIAEAAQTGSSTNAGIADAPSNGTLYARQSGAWVAVPTNSGTGSGGGGTTLRKSGIDLLGTYALGDGLVVNGSTVDVDAAAVSGIAMDTVSNAARSVVGEMLTETNTSSPASKGFVLSNLGDSSFPPFAGTGGEYALMRTVSDGVTQTVWRIIRGQLANSLNASFMWSNYGVTNKFYANGTNEQTYTIPAGITQVVIKCFGAGGGGGYAGSGGTTIQALNVTPGVILTIRVGTRGLLATNNAGGVGGWPGGGNGYGMHTTTGTGGGGGYSAVVIGTNLMCIAGGGGGAGGGNVSGHHGGAAGGGLSGANVPSGSTGGTQSGGGNMSGSYLRGGNGSTNSPPTGGGGGGYYGGGGGVNTFCGGAGGSGYVCDKYGYTYQGLLTGDADYESGIGVAGGNGMVVILHDAPTEGE